MSETLYTLKEMAAILASAFSEDDTLKCARKIRHWTLMDLLEPVGKKHTGTGTSRRYSIREIRRAAILMELSLWKVPMPVIIDNFDEMLDNYEEGEEWQKALDLSANVFLSLSYNEDLVNWQMTVDTPKLMLLSKPEDPSELPLYDAQEPDFDPANPIDEILALPSLSSAIVLNVTKIFYRLKI